MTGEKESPLRAHIKQNWLVWSALHHLLPLSILRELSHVVVEKISGSSLRFDDLFLEGGLNESDVMASWYFQPIQTESDIGYYLKQRIRCFGGQGDGFVATPSGGYHRDDVNYISPDFFEKVIELGRSGLSVPETFLDTLESQGDASFEQFVTVFRNLKVNLRDDFGLTETIDFQSEISEFHFPLNVLVAKHLGDLCADADYWKVADKLYGTADLMLSDSTSGWEVLVAPLKSIIHQSRAAAAHTLVGVEGAMELYGKMFSDDKCAGDVLMNANASLDYLNATINSALYKSFSDTRLSLCSSPTLIQSHSLAVALKKWLAKDYGEAHRAFWAILRRQTALGSVTESRITKKLFARCIVEFLIDVADSRLDKNLFNLALRFLLESTFWKEVSLIDWPNEIVDLYVDEDVVANIINHITAHKGVEIERESVAIELFRIWVEKIELSKSNIANEMHSYIATTALKSPTSIEANKNISGRCLEALESIARKRPELRKALSSDIARVVSSKIQGDEFWAGQEKALSLAIEYVDVFSMRDLEEIIESVLDVLEKSKNWPINQAAISLLVSESSRTYINERPKLVDRVISTIVDVGVSQESEHTRVLHYLHAFKPCLLEDVSVRERLDGVIAYVLKKSQEINSSNVGSNILALLIAPNFSGREGVKAALIGIEKVICSVTNKRPSLGLTFLYDSILYVCSHIQEISDSVSLSRDEFKKLLKPILHSVMELWLEAKVRPEIFATFSFSEKNKPDSVIVHNWAFASLSIAKLLGQEKKMLGVLDEAESHPLLKSSIVLAKATESLAEDSPDISVDSILSENAETFYTVLGRRLSILNKVDDDMSREICSLLLSQCLKFGPREIDTAVFVISQRLGLSEAVNNDCNYQDYFKRLQVNRDLRLVINPILQ